MTTLGYCVLWMPTIIHKDFVTPDCDTIDFFELSDALPEETLNTNNDFRVFAKLEISNNQNIKISFAKGNICNYERLDTYTIYLSQKDRSHNGLISYQIEAADASNPFFLGKDGKLKFPCAIYHKIKEFYHRHNFHKENEGDSMIEPFISDKYIDIKSTNNQALLHYLNIYERKFINEYEYLENIFNKLANVGLLSKIRFFFGWDNHDSFYNMAMRIKGDKAYFKSLYHSCYNSAFKIDNGDDETGKGNRRKTFNIQNIVESVDAMEEKIGNIFNISIARISFWVAVSAIVLSVLLTKCNQA